MGVLAKAFPNLLIITTNKKKWRDPKIIKKGIPQGTILRPILFVAYVNSIFQVYLDDTVIS